MIENQLFYEKLNGKKHLTKAKQFMSKMGGNQRDQ